MPLPHPGQNQLPLPTSTAELAPAERFIVWAFRRWVLGLKQNTGDHWTLVWNEFARQLGDRDGRDALCGFAGLVKAMQCHARRRISYHQPCCPFLGADEVSIVCFVAACQNEHPQLSRSLAEWLVKADGADEMLEAGTRLSAGMHRHALLLPQRSGTSGTPPAMMETHARAAALH